MARRRQAAASRMALYLDTGPIEHRMRLAPDMISAAVATTFKFYESQIENSAKTNAPWTDRTSNARNGLTARAGKNGNTHFVILAHQVPYGLFLEIKHSGANAIIMPTIDQFGPKVMHTLQKILDRL